MLSCNIDYLSRDLTLCLRQYSNRSRASNVEIGLPTLLKVVLKLKNVGDYPGLQDALQSLLVQLDLSWTDPEAPLTIQILEIILIFVKSFEPVDKEEEKLKDERCRKYTWTERNFEKGALTQLVLGMSIEEKREDIVCYRAYFFPRAPITNENHFKMNHINGGKMFASEPMSCVKKLET